MYNLSDTILVTMFIKTARHMHSRVSIQIHSKWQKKCTTTKGTNNHEDGRALGGLHPVPNDDDDDDGGGGGGGDLLKTTKEHTTSSSNDWRHLLHFQNEQLLTSIY
jgi:hypothetical protein